MIKKIFSFTLFTLLFGVSFAYSPLSKVQHQQIDLQLSGFSNLSKSEKSKEADFFLRLAQKSLEIRQAFSGGKGKIPGAKLTEIDKLYVQKKIESLAKLSNTELQQELSDLKETQLMSTELGRSLQIESLASFQGYGETKIPTPLYRMPKDDFAIHKLLAASSSSTGIKLDQQNLIRELAVVLPPQTPVTLIGEYKVDGYTYYLVRTREFDAWAGAKHGYFLDARFIKKLDKKAEEVFNPLPSRDTIIKNLLATKGSTYVRGGSRYQGLPQMESFFPSQTPLSSIHKKHKNLEWVDCSGLLREANGGNTPRNTRQLLNVGKPVSIEWLTLEQIINQVQPLDIIVRDGHVVVILDQTRAIESRRRPNFKGWVEITKLKSRLTEILKTRTPVNDYTSSPLSKTKKFVIRRRYGE